jgi:hypothetical protein
VAQVVGLCGAPGGFYGPLVQSYGRLTTGGSASRGIPSPTLIQVVIIDSGAVQAPAGWVVLATEGVAGPGWAKMRNEDALRC